MTTVEYNGYQGSVVFEDGRLVIQILHIDDIITADCDKASDVESAFQELVDDYIETCNAVGKEPNRPFKGSFNVRVGPLLHKRVAMAAARSEETLNAWVVGAITQRLDRESDPNGQIIFELLKVSAHLTPLNSLQSIWSEASPQGAHVRRPDILRQFASRVDEKGSYSMGDRH